MLKSAKTIKYNKNGWNDGQFTLFNAVNNTFKVAPQKFFHTQYHYCPRKPSKILNGIKQYLLDYPIFTITIGMSLASTFYGYYLPDANRGFFTSLVGQSRCGKTVSARVATLFTGSQLFTWEGTLKGILSLATTHQHSCLFLDELKTVRKTEGYQLPELIYSLANGIGRVRALRNGNTAPTWRGCLSCLSTSELYLEQCCSGLKGGLMSRSIELEVSPNTIPQQIGAELYALTQEKDDSILLTIAHHIATQNPHTITTTQQQIHKKLLQDIEQEGLSSTNEETRFSLESLAWGLTAATYVSDWLALQLPIQTAIKEIVIPSYLKNLRSIPVDALEAAKRMMQLVTDNTKIYRQYAPTPRQECGFVEYATGDVFVFTYAITEHIFDGKANHVIIRQLQKLSIIGKSTVKRVAHLNRNTRGYSVDMCKLDELLSREIAAKN